MKKQWIVGAALAGLLSSGAWAQKLPVYESTGTINLVADGKKSTYHTTSGTVPTQEGVVIHTARWKIFPPMMMGPTNMAPPGVTVSLSSRPTVQPDPQAPELKITFSLDENNYALLDTVPIEVIYTVKSGASDEKYEHTSGTIDIESVTPVGPDVLEIKGRAAGTLSTHKKNKKVAGKTLNYETDFAVRAHRY